MNIEQQEHRICEIIRAVCEQNDVGVTFSAEPASATGATVVCAQYDLGRARRRSTKWRAVAMAASTICLIGALVAVNLYFNPVSAFLFLLSLIPYGISLYLCVSKDLTPLVSRHSLDQQIAYALSAEGHSVIKGAGKTEIYFPDES